LEYVARRCPDVQFVCAGHGPIDPRRWNLPNVRVFSDLFGPRLAALYRASDVLILPSVGEGFPLVVQEALACGLAVICGRDTATADEHAAPLLRGIEVSPHDPQATAARITTELERLPGHNWENGERTRRIEFARGSYSWPASAARYAAILRELVLARAAQPRR
jgi:glycosyltransferase involved in cell wall biosynthesis